jgi:ABC-type lipoprotein export system ATPase subunit
MAFTKAVKFDEKGRIALMGPSGSGKSFTALEIAAFLAQMVGKRIAAVDTENRSLRKYASLYDFDVEEPRT